MTFEEKKLDGGQLPSGMTYDDLYAYLYTLGDAISKEATRYDDWMSFPIMTNNDNGRNSLCCLQYVGDRIGDNSHNDFHKKKGKRWMMK